MPASNFHRQTLAALLAAASLASFPAATLADHSWGGYHWARTSNPLLLSLGDNVSPAWDSYLATASVEWSRSSVLQTAVVAGATRPRNCKAAAGRVEVCSARYGFNGWLGVAQIWVMGTHIARGATKLNDSYFETATYDAPGWRNLVMCQEIGHTFGLDHQDENFSNPNLGTCMDYTSNPDGPPLNWYPNAHDYEQLEAIYAHLDGGGTVAQAAARVKAAAPAAAGDEPLEAGTAQWGRLIRSTNRGHTELFELDLGAGQKLFTFVIWADPEGRGRR
jgi:hypothetical protein